MAASDSETAGNGPAPEMRRGVSRRTLITDELGRAGVKAARQLPALASVFGFAVRQREAARDELLVRALWKLCLDREPRGEEQKASLEMMRNASSPDEKSDALVDVLWALCQTAEFEEVRRPARVLVRGLFRVAVNREPTAQEEEGALRVLAEADAAGSRGAALEGLLTGLLRQPESVFRCGQKG
jgi:hypothetical protein